MNDNSSWWHTLARKSGNSLARRNERVRNKNKFRKTKIIEVSNKEGLAVKANGKKKEKVKNYRYTMMTEDWKSTIEIKGRIA